jgi:excisionase family DNA binding protein
MLLSAAQLAALFSVSERTIERWLAAGRIQARRIGHRYEVSEEELQRLTSERDPRGELEALREEAARLEREVQALRNDLAQLNERVTLLEIRPPAQPEPTREPRQVAPVISSSAAGDMVAASAFAVQHGVNDRTWRDYVAGKRWNDRIETTLKGQVHYLTSAQQAEAIRFFRRHHVDFTPCERCPHEQGQ